MRANVTAVIRGYPIDATVYPGDRLALATSGTGARFEAQWFRCGREVAELPERCEGSLVDAAPGACDTPWDWPVTEWTIPETWQSGAYVAKLVADGRDDAVRPDRTGATLDARSGRALIVVRPHSPRASLLVVLPTFTYQAYNVAHVDGTLHVSEGECLYSGARWVTLLRPGGGIGGHPWDEGNPDAYDTATPRQTFAHWDAKALAWLEREGYAYDLCTDLDLHRGRIDLGRYSAIASFGHHEYWSEQMRSSVERFVAEGGNAAFFGGNTMWFRVEFDDARTAIRRDGRWLDEWTFTGVTYAHGGGRWVGPRPAAPFRVVDPAHPLLAGLGLRPGLTFGADEALAGYECDGAPHGSDLSIAAIASLETWPASDESGERATRGTAALGSRKHGLGHVFTASTVDWIRVAAAGEPVVNGITRNVLDAFGARG